MKFLCPNCKAKYQIADEKVSGRTLRMDCRRCGHNITIRADMAIDDVEDVAPKQPAPAPLAAKPSPASTSASRRAGLTGAHTAQPAGTGAGHTGAGHTGAGHTGAGHTGGSHTGALGADFHRSVSKSHTIGSAPEPQRATPLDQWHVAINDVPVGPLRREEIVKKIGAGAVTADSLCWREGLDDWRPLRDVPELAALLRRSLAPEAPARPGAAGRAPVAGPPRAAAPAHAAAGRPATGAHRPAARSNVVPIGGRLGGAAAPALEDDGLENNEPTRVGTVDLADLEAKALAAESKHAEAKRDADKELFPEVGRPPTGKTNLKGPGGLAPPPKPMGRPETGKTALPSVSAKAAPKHEPKLEPKHEPKLEPVADDHDLPFAEPSFADVPESPVAAPAPLPAPTPTPAPAPAFVAAPTPAPVPAPASVAPREERRGLPIPALIAIAGATAFGGVMAFMIGTRFLGPAAPTTPAVATIQPAATTVPATTAPPPTAEITPPTTTPPATTEAVAEVPTTTAPPATTTAGGGGHARPHTPTTPTTPTSSGTTSGTGGTGAGAGAATKAPTGRFAEFADDSSGGPAQIATSGRRSIADDPEDGAGTTRGQQELTADQIRSVITRERPAVNRCWESELRRIGQAATVRLDVDLTIGGSGTVTSVTTRGQSVGTLADCIERNVRRWRFPPTSGVTQTSFPLVFSGTE